MFRGTAEKIFIDAGGVSASKAKSELCFQEETMKSAIVISVLLLALYIVKIGIMIWKKDD